MMEVEKQVANELAQVIEAGSAAILDPELALQRRAERRFRAIAASPVHETKKPQAIAIITEAREAIVSALRRSNFDQLDKALADFDRKFRYSGLQTVEVEPTEREKWERIFQNHGWDSQDRDAAFRRVKPGEKIDSVDWNGFGLSGRRISREQVRLGLRPAWSKVPDAEWLAKFGPIRRIEMVEGEMREVPVHGRMPA